MIPGKSSWWNPISIRFFAKAGYKPRNKKKTWDKNLHHSYENGANLCDVEVVKILKNGGYWSGEKT